MKSYKKKLPLSAFGSVQSTHTVGDPGATPLTLKIGRQAVSFLVSECFKIVRMFYKIYVEFVHLHLGEQSESQLPHNWPWKLAAGVEMNCRKIILLPLLDTSLLKPISCTSFHAWYCGEWVVLFLLLFWILLSLLWNLLSCHILIWSKPGERQCLWGKNLSHVNSVETYTSFQS